MTELRISKIAREKWFHAIDFGGVASKGRFPEGTPQNNTLFGTMEFLKLIQWNGSEVVLDVGTYDGLTAFGMKRLGAGAVYATDTLKRNTFILARSLLGFDADINYFPGTQFSNIGKKLEGLRFDLIVCSGIIYHMLNPMHAFTESRKLLSNDGIFIVETPYFEGRDEPILRYNGIDPIFPEPYSYFIPTISAIEGMAYLSGFSVLGIRTIKGPTPRVTLMLKASSREELRSSEDCPRFVKEMLKRDIADIDFNFRKLEASNSARSEIIHDAVSPRNRFINCMEEDVIFPFHPRRGTPSFGSTAWETASGNNKE